MTPMMTVRPLLLAASLLLPAALASQVVTEGGDWPMWGGTPSRNMVSGEKGLPHEWNVETKKNVKWSAELGSESYGNPVVSNGMVFVGTNNENPRDPKQAGDRGVLMAFREATGGSSGSRPTPSWSRGRSTTGPSRASRLLPWSRATASTT